VIELELDQGELKPEPSTRARARLEPNLIFSYFRLKIKRKNNKLNLLIILFYKTITKFVTGE
jgi:hypothetical protein